VGSTPIYRGSKRVYDAIAYFGVAQPAGASIHDDQIILVIGDIDTTDTVVDYDSARNTTDLNSSGTISDLFSA
jgi:hypothetical protein